MFKSPKILILDDHSLFSEGLGEILKNHFQKAVIHKFQSIQGLKSQSIDLNSFQLIISDIELPEENIFDFLRTLKSEYPKIPVLIISMHNKLSIIKKCKELAIEGYILKDDHELIITAVETLLNNKTYYSKKVQETFSLLNKKEKLLTPREEEIIKLISKGKNNQQIAEILFISINTITTHRKNINQKLNISNVGELIKYYYENYI
jgi:DNA-binding NarL/FixJ family response regulator